MPTCTFCGSDLEQYDPVIAVAEEHDDGAETVGRFCNYACLTSHVEEAGLETGACCRI